MYCCCLVDGWIENSDVVSLVMLCKYFCVGLEGCLDLESGLIASNNSSSLMMISAMLIVRAVCVVKL